MAVEAEEGGSAFELDLHLSLGELHRKLQHYFDWLQPRPVSPPPATKTTPAAASTYTMLDLGGPPTPQVVWEVRQVYVYVNDIFAAAVSTTSVCAYTDVRALPDSSSEPIFPNMAIGAGQVPNTAEFTGRQLALHYPEHLILCIKGASNSTQYVGGLKAEEYDLRLIQRGAHEPSYPA